jgi:hypothetical protein
MSINGNGDTLTITGARLKVSGGVQVSGSIAYTDDATGFGGVSAQIDTDNTTLNITAGKTSGVAKIERGTTTNITGINHANVSNNTTIHIALKNTSSNKGDFVTIGTFADDDTVKVNYTDEYVIGPGETGMLTLRKVAGVLSLFIREMFSSNATNTNTKPFYIKDGTNYKYPLYTSADNGGNLEGVTINGVQYYRPSSGLKTKTRPPLGIPELIVTPTGNLAIGNSVDLTTVNYDVWGVPSSFDFGNIYQGSTKKVSFVLENGEASGSFTESGASSGDAYTLYVDKTDTSTSDTLNIDTSGFAGTIAFHHDTFANSGDPYGDGSVATAAANGRFYADTSSYTGDIGTITVLSGFSTPTIVANLDDTPANGDGINTWSGVSFIQDTTVKSTSLGAYGGSGTLADPWVYRITTNSGVLDNADHVVIWPKASFDGSGCGWADATLDTSVTPNIVTERSGFGTPNPSGQTVSSTGLVEWTYNNTSTVGYTFQDPYFNIGHTTSLKTSYTWTPPNDIEGTDVLMVAGGGGGGGFSGGGGAGGLLFHEGETISGQKTIVIGNGGVGGIGYSNEEEEVGTSGYNTSFTGLTTTIGGGGGGGYNYDGLTGGSGGGAGFITQIGGSGTSGQGYAGGNSSGESAGGGGGAGGVGENGTDDVHSGDGGLGVDYTSVFGTMYGDGGWFASGGGAGCRLDISSTMTIGTASQGGGTDGTNTSTKAQDAQKHTGGGGGGGGYNNSTTSILGGTGGSGIVLVKTTGILGKTIPKVTGASFDSTNVTFTVQGSSGITNIKYTINGGSEQTTPVGTLAVAHGLSASASITVVAYAVDANGDQISTKKTVTGTIP